MKRPVAGRASWAIAVCTGSLLIAGSGLLVSFLVRHPSALPVHTAVPLFYDIPVALAFGGVSVAILRRLPAHPIGWLFGVLGVAVSLGHFTNAYAAWRMPGTTWVLWIVGRVRRGHVLQPCLGAATVPDRAYDVAVVAVVGAAAVAVSCRLHPGQCRGTLAQSGWPSSTSRCRSQLGWPANPLGNHAPGWLADANALMAPVGIALMLASLTSLLPRWRRSTGDEREQIKWFGLAALLVGGEFTFGFIQFVSGGMADQDPMGELLGNAFFTLIVIGIPIAIGLGVVRYRLYEIDAYISRTLVFGGLAVFIGGVYVFFVILIAGSLIDRWTGSSTWLALAATACVAVAFHPVRIRLQSSANRLVFGDRARPYELMTRLGRQMEEALAPNDVLACIAETAGRTVNARAVRVSTTLASGEILMALWPPAAARGDASYPALDLVVPVRHDGTALAEIAVAPSSDRAADIDMLRHIAAISASALRNLRLLAELESLHETIERQIAEIAASRARLSAAAAAERRRVDRVMAHRLGPGPGRPADRSADLEGRSRPSTGHCGRRVRAPGRTCLSRRRRVARTVARHPSSHPGRPRVGRRAASDASTA